AIPFIPDRDPDPGVRSGNPRVKRARGHVLLIVDRRRAAQCKKLRPGPLDQPGVIAFPERLKGSSVPGFQLADPAGHRSGRLVRGGFRLVHGSPPYRDIGSDGFNLFYHASWTGTSFLPRA